MTGEIISLDGSNGSVHRRQRQQLCHLSHRQLFCMVKNRGLNGYEKWFAWDSNVSFLTVVRTPVPTVSVVISWMRDILISTGRIHHLSDSLLTLYSLCLIHINAQISVFRKTSPKLLSWLKFIFKKNSKIIENFSRLRTCNKIIYSFSNICIW